MGSVGGGRGGRGGGRGGGGRAFVVDAHGHTRTESPAAVAVGFAVAPADGLIFHCTTIGKVGREGGQEGGREGAEGGQGREETLVSFLEPKLSLACRRTN